MRFRRLLLIALCLPALAAGQAVPDPYSLCPAPPPAPQFPGEEPPAGATFISSETLEAERDGRSTFVGGVVVRRQEQFLTGDLATYDQPSDHLVIEGNVALRTRDTFIEGSRAEMRLEQESGVFHDGRFRLTTGHGAGSAGRVEVINPQLTHLHDATYSTCPPDDQDWRLDARRMALDEATNTGEAWHAKLSFMDVPLLYLPYLNFPLEGRKTGLLLPAFGTSDTGGIDISIPWYWNIAPDRDATFTPRYIEQRGTMLYSEFRYLNPLNAGQVNVDYLPDDQLYRDDRLYAAFEHNHRLSEGWRATAIYNYVSDPEYFDDVSDSQSTTSQTHLERRLDLAYRGVGWSFRARAQGYQALTGNEPYQRLPQLVLRAATPQRRGEPVYGINAELVNFVHESRDPTGTRVDLSPNISLPLQGAAWFLTPRLDLRYTEYRLEEADDAVDRRALPLASIDSGLFFEREFTLGDAPLLQTLEPRLFYLHVPFENQGDLPNFDTGSYDFTFAQLFRTNRFSGADRVGDANQLTTALTSRLLDANSGRELAAASIGQIQYFRDREVTLAPGAAAETTPSSDVVAELTLSPVESLNVGADVRWNPHEAQQERLNAGVRYRPAPGKAVSLSYRQHEARALEQTDLGFYWPVARHWNVLGRWNYDLIAERDLDTIFGVEYQDCCWALRVLRRTTLNTSSLELDRSVLITLELKGLAHIGRRLDSEIERGILGYD